MSVSVSVCALCVVSVNAFFVLYARVCYNARAQVYVSSTREYLYECLCADLCVGPWTHACVRWYKYVLIYV